MGTVTKAIVITIRPQIKVVFTHKLRVSILPNGEAPYLKINMELRSKWSYLFSIREFLIFLQAETDTVPILNWQFSYFRDGGKIVTAPILAFGRKSTIYLFRVRSNLFHEVSGIYISLGSHLHTLFLSFRYMCSTASGSSSNLCNSWSFHTRFITFVGWITRPSPSLIVTNKFISKTYEQMMSWKYLTVQRLSWCMRLNAIRDRIQEGTLVKQWWGSLHLNLSCFEFVNVFADNNCVPTGINWQQGVLQYNCRLWQPDSHVGQEKYPRVHPKIMDRSRQFLFQANTVPGSS